MAWAALPLETGRSCGGTVEGLKRLSMRRRMTVGKETVGRRRSTGH